MLGEITDEIRAVYCSLRKWRYSVDRILADGLRDQLAAKLKIEHRESDYTCIDRCAMCNWTDSAWRAEADRLLLGP